MDLNKILQLIGLIVAVIVALVILGLVLRVAIGFAQIALIAAVIAGMYFFAERAFGKGR